MAAVSGSKRFLLIAGRKTHAWGDAQPEGRRSAERHCQSVEKIENAFVEALQAKKLSQISVSDICKATEINRSTFYANFVDIYALSDQARAHLEDEFNQLYALEVEQKFNSNDYHITFFKIGLNAIIKRWLNGGCRETPEEISAVNITADVPNSPPGLFRRQVLDHTAVVFIGHLQCQSAQF